MEKNADNCFLLITYLILGIYVLGFKKSIQKGTSDASLFVDVNNLGSFVLSRLTFFNVRSTNTYLSTEINNEMHHGECH